MNLCTLCKAYMWVDDDSMVGKQPVRTRYKICNKKVLNNNTQVLGVKYDKSTKQETNRMKQIDKKTKEGQEYSQPVQ